MKRLYNRFDYLTLPHRKKPFDIFPNKCKGTLCLENSDILLIKDIPRVVNPTRPRKAETLTWEATKHYVRIRYGIAFNLCNVATYDFSLTPCSKRLAGIGIEIVCPNCPETSPIKTKIKSARPTEQADRSEHISFLAHTP